MNQKQNKTKSRFTLFQRTERGKKIPHLTLKLADQDSKIELDTDQ